MSPESQAQWASHSPPDLLLICQVEVSLSCPAWHWTAFVVQEALKPAVLLPQPELQVLALMFPSVVVLSFILMLGRQRQVGLYEFESILVYTARLRPARDT